MAALEWNDGLNVGMGFMDDDHAVAAGQINALAEADLKGRQELLPHFIDHCREHFAREQEMMEKTGFFAMHCHVDEHTRVLAELEAVLAKLQAGDAQDRYFTTGLAEWLMNHRNTMDYVTADFARSKGFK